MRVLLIGKGGREHALAWKIAKSKLLSALYLWPGNAAMGRLGLPLGPAATADLDTVVEAARRHHIDLVVSGPEAPLTDGLADRCAAAGLPVFGPVAAVAQLEASKAYAKAVMGRSGIPTAAYRQATTEGECRARAGELLAASGGVVLKASGLAAGKGVFVCATAADVEAALVHLYHSPMRAAAATVVVEEVLRGRECSYFAWLGGGAPLGLGFAVDFKRLEDGDLGPNTGGMGCYAPVPWLPPDAEQQVLARVVEPLLATLRADGHAYCGCLYVGLMWSEAAGPQVIEFNVRLGDPEAQVLALYDDRDWLAVIAAQAGVAVPPAALAAASAPVAHAERAVVVVMAAAPYPFGVGGGVGAELPAGLFAGAAAADDGPAGRLAVFGAALSPGAEGCGLRTGVGRVLNVAARAPSYAAARALAYGKVQEIAARWPDARWRGDIGKRVAEEAGG